MNTDNADSRFQELERNRPGIELLYFRDCPNAEIARKVLVESGIKDFAEVDLEKLPIQDPLRSYSSPSLLVSNSLVFGAKSSDYALSCALITEDDIKNCISNRLDLIGGRL